MSPGARHGPPRLAAWLLRRLLPAALRDEASDELAELYALWAERDGPAAAAHRYRRQVVGYALRLRMARLSGAPLVIPTQRPGGRGAHLAGLWTDLRFAVRMWRRLPGTAAVIIGSVALGVGACATVFSWGEGLIWHPLPAVDQPERLVSLKPRRPTGSVSVAWQEFRDWRDQAESFAGTAAFNVRRLGLRATGVGDEHATVALWATLVSGDYFAVLGVTPRIGRLIGPDDARVEGDGFVAVISEALWQSHFGSAPDIVGRQLMLNGRQFTVVGVAAPRFGGTYVGLQFDVWVPLSIQQALGGEPAAFHDRGIRWLNAFARLRPGVTRPPASLETAHIGRRLAATHEADHDVALSLEPLDVGAANRLAPLFGVLLGLTIVVLAVVCATVANLLLARAASRDAEMAVRLAIGARPGRLVRQLLTESGVLAAIAGALGLLLAVRARDLFPALLPASPLPLAIDTPLDARVLGFALAVTLLTVLLVGLAPALQAVRVAAAGLGVALRGDRRRARWRRVLVAAQIALSLTALASTAMFAGRLAALRTVDRGFQAPEEVLLAATDLEMAGIADGTERRAVVERLVAATRRLPAVRGVTVATFVPLGFTGYREVALDVPGYEPRRSERPLALLNEVGSDYFDVLRIPLLAGRPIVESDRSGGQGVVVVNEALVGRYGLRDPVGRRLRVGGRDVVVVGVARNGKYRFDELDQPARPLAYVPWYQWGGAEVTLHVRTAGNPSTLVAEVQGVFADADARLPLLAPTTLDAYTSLPLFPGRLATSVLGVLAASALALSALGLYAVTSLALASRRRELGIRMALGASAGRVARLLFGDSARLAVVGLAVGLALTLLVTRLLVAMLPRLRPDPLAIVAAGVLLFLIAVAAVGLAARGALGIDPATALRSP